MPQRSASFDAGAGSEKQRKEGLGDVTPCTFCMSMKLGSRVTGSASGRELAKRPLLGEPWGTPVYRLARSMAGEASAAERLISLAAPLATGEGNGGRLDSGGRYLAKRRHVNNPWHQQEHRSAHRRE